MLNLIGQSNLQPIEIPDIILIMSESPGLFFDGVLKSVLFLNYEMLCYGKKTGFNFLDDTDF